MASTKGRLCLPLLPEHSHSSHTHTACGMYSHLGLRNGSGSSDKPFLLSLWGHCFVLCVMCSGSTKMNINLPGWFPSGMGSWSTPRWLFGNLLFLELWAEDPFLVSCEPGATSSNQRPPLLPAVSHSPEASSPLIPVRLPGFPSQSVISLTSSL